ncbi:uncharacterized protein LOC6575745 [Drosophila mojavensis]|uniref:Uncharacterized protein n=1 Tax=Drosophila mojavensis TaxID=7230 RepID=B4KHC8_DROMO|nr:uncharacterized protein LOC6575745 [Drosophila mojavensis]EDW11192.2 uncharacterized protein Dmoj_GI17020 [Drosophila mojavensis]
METLVNRAQNRSKIEPRPRYEKSKSFFNADYVPQSRGAYRLPSLPSEDKPDRQGADGDCLLYKNSKFGKDSAYTHSDHSDHSEQLLSIPPDHSPRKLKTSTSMLESTRERCRLATAQFNAKYGATDSPSSKSARTVITTKSGENLRSVVQSEIEMQERMEKSISKIMLLPSLGLSEETDCAPVEDEEKFKIPKSVSKDNSVPMPAPADNHNFDFSVEDIVSSKVIAPMMRRVQRMYLNNLQEEMKLMEDLERVPCMVGEVYRSVESAFGPNISKKKPKNTF